MGVAVRQLVIALATALYLFGNGRVAGIAGILASPLRAVMAGTSLRPDANRLLFALGLLPAPWCWRRVSPLPTASIDGGNLGLIIAGLLVGIGVRMGNGCTSGHVVCGSSCFSVRSLVNVLAFMGAGFITVFVQRHLTFVFARAATRERTWAGAAMEIPAIRTIDRRLVLGGVLFGVGWGIAGFCPGPVRVALGSGMGAAGVFVAAVLTGMVVHDKFLVRR